MDFHVRCECGKPHSVAASAAGTWLPCTCGREFQVPPLSQLRRQAGLSHGGLNPVLVIEQMLLAGELPGEQEACAHCGTRTDALVIVSIQCERVQTEVRGGVPSWLFLSFAILLGHIIWWREQEVRQFGKDIILRLPVRLCPECQTEVRDTEAIKDLLRQVPIYGQLLQKYPEATVSLAKSIE